MFLALLMAQATPADRSYPLEIVLNESRDTCALLLDPERADEGFADRGWRPISVEPSGWLADYVQSNRQIGPTLDMSAYDALLEKRVSDRNLILYVFGLAPRTSTERNWASCEVIDLAAAGPISEADVVRWAGREPMPGLPFGNNILLRWVPSLTEGAADSSVTFSPVNSPLARIRPGLIYTLVMPPRPETQ